MSDNGLILRGSAFLAELNSNDVPQGWSDPLNMVELSLELGEPTVATRQSNHAHNAGAALNSVQTGAGEVTASLSIDTIDGELLAMALGADWARATVAAKVAVETPVALFPGKRSFVGAKACTAIVPSAGNPLVAGTDFTVDLALGTVKAIVGGAVVSGTSYNFDVSAPAYTRDVLGGGRATYTVALRMIGIDKVTGQAFEFNAPKLPLTGTQTFDMASGEYSTVNYTGIPVELNGNPAYTLEPYGVSA